MKKASTKKKASTTPTKTAPSKKKARGAKTVDLSKPTIVRTSESHPTEVHFDGDGKNGEQVEIPFDEAEDTELEDDAGADDDKSFDDDEDDEVEDDSAEKDPDYF